VEDSVVVENRIAGSTSDQPNEVEVVTSILSQLSKVDPAIRERIIHTLATFYRVDLRGTSSTRQQAGSGHSATLPESTFSEDRSISPKQFMGEKQPHTDVEKVACLAYYLTHYGNMPHFKTLDISKLNTEAAQIKFSNPAVAMENAVKRHYLVPATKGNKQLSALGEQFVQSLPDREKARAVMANARPRRRTRRIEGEIIESDQVNE
jgi:hypothetical protein